jgi:hypothetical protein
VEGLAGYPVHLHVLEVLFERSSRRLIKWITLVLHWLEVPFTGLHSLHNLELQRFQLLLLELSILEEIGEGKMAFVG